MVFLEHSHSLTCASAPGTAGLSGYDRNCPAYIASHIYYLPFIGKKKWLSFGLHHSLEETSESCRNLGLPWGAGDGGDIF